LSESNDGPETPYERLESATRTLAKERRFFHALLDDRPVALVVNRIIHLSTFFKGAERSIPLYLEHQAHRLFPDDSLQVAAILAHLLQDVTRTARLAAYLCVKGIPDQALAALRGALEQLGVYTHVWHDPSKYRYVPDSDSDEYADAFRHPPKALAKELNARDVKFRFMHCHGGKAVSHMYSVLSGMFVHGTSAVDGQPELSCDFVDRGAPGALAMNYQLVRAILAIIYLETFESIPEEDRLSDELAGLSISSALFLPLLSSASEDVDPELKQASERLLEALRTVRFEDDAAR
jgi:hypothetical protein